MNTKETLNKLKQDTTMIQHADIDSMLALMFAEIGSTDAELRDSIIYSLFSEMIVYQPLTIQQLHEIREKALSHEGMFYKIGERNTDSVFTRSFSVLLLPLLLERNNREYFLVEDQIQEIKQAILRYLSEEKDFRGYIAEKGWGHALAHISDAIESISEHRWTVLESSSILDRLKTILQSDDTILTNQEEERILIAIMPMIIHQLIDKSILEGWIQSLADFESTNDTAKDYVILHNTKTFLSALYFRLKKHPSLHTDTNLIENAFDQLKQRFYLS
ncbi:DUF2785 domain-containing protein [Paenibacillus hunanensis]|uniref:DUF2785 domain-containing protein n=1 Tax=Paenibacillus hunanensis TaxID=539262 RepID=A0ABU1J2J9_9BACL|nr:DUF2785 domain-containing protein [Paenibacillus hunanensis]MDR6245744.1 hypothetical protein [Paenibacillus hunanensis]